MRNALALDQIFPPVCTHFTANGDLDLAALASNIGKYNAAAFGGYVVTGSTGEAVMLSERERAQVWETVRDAAQPEHLLVAGTAAQSLRETLSMTATAASLGYHAALVLTPYFFKAQMQRPESQIDFFHAVADAASVPVILYNFPQMTGIDLPVELMAKIVEHPNIAGVKESSADFEKIKALAKTLPRDCPLLVGASAIFAQCLDAGAAGGILASGNVLPMETGEILTRYRAGDKAGAEAVQAKIKDAGSVAAKFGIQGLKYGMGLMGLAGGECRRPLLPLDAAQKSAIDELFQPFL